MSRGTGTNGESRAPAWKEDEWEPPEPSGHLIPLEELRNKIAHGQREHAKKGHVQISGRTIIVCHTLPYTCNLVEGDQVGTPTSTYGHGLEIKAQVLSQDELLTPTLAADVTLPHQNLPTASSPTSIYRDPRQPLSPSHQKDTRWVLSPRRVHAALNAGVKSLSENRKVLMVAWPGDIRDVNGEKIGAGTLLADQKKKLEEGFADASGKDEEKGIACVPVWMKDKTASAFYNDYCKSFLWPTFHYLGLTDHQEKEKEAIAWKAYYDANVAYANKVAEVYKDGDLIWVQDYHLLLVPKLLREMFPKAAIGLFLHSPFPSSEFFRCLPRRETILNGMLGANLCCFQTYSYGRHFLSSCVRVCGYEPLEGGIGVDAKGSVTSIAYCPIGIDSDRIEAERKSDAISPKIEALRQLYKGKKIIVGRDKLDSTKGVLPKLEAFESFLEQFQEWIGNVVLIQVTTPTANDSPDVARKISRIVDHINV